MIACLYVIHFFSYPKRFIFPSWCMQSTLLNWYRNITKYELGKKRMKKSTYNYPLQSCEKFTFWWGLHDKRLLNRSIFAVGCQVIYAEMWRIWFESRNCLQLNRGHFISESKSLCNINRQTTVFHIDGKILLAFFPPSFHLELKAYEVNHMFKFFSCNKQVVSGNSVCR